MKKKLQGNLKKETFKVMKDGEFVEIEIDVEANEANVRKI